MIIDKEIKEHSSGLFDIEIHTHSNGNVYYWSKVRGGARAPSFDGKTEHEAIYKMLKWFRKRN